MSNIRRIDPFGRGAERLIPGRERLPGDLLPKKVSGGAALMYREGQVPGPVGIREAEDMRKYFGNAIYVGRSLVGRSVVVGVTPTLLIQEPIELAHFILNPSTSVGLTTTVTGANGNFVHNQVTAPGIGVSGFDVAHFNIVVTAVTPGDSWTINLQNFDAISGTWITTQALVAGVLAAGSFYAYPGAFGIGTDIRFQFVEAAAGANPITVSIGVILKNGIGGSSAGLAQVVYLGGEGVSTVSGFPLLEGQSQVFIVGENVDLWGVAPNNITVRIFTM